MFHNLQVKNAIYTGLLEVVYSRSDGEIEGDVYLQGPPEGCRAFTCLWTGPRGSPEPSCLRLALSVFLELHFTRRGLTPWTSWSDTAWPGLSARHDEGPRASVLVNVPRACYGRASSQFRSNRNWLEVLPKQEAQGAPDPLGSGSAQARTLRDLPVFAPRQGAVQTGAWPHPFLPLRSWSPTPQPQTPHH